ncbi:MAG: hypothetical protein INR70_11370 [Parafilimonas terrae]|nr:hypothetical protein [Parafilimonas terrae]
MRWTTALRCGLALVPMLASGASAEIKEYQIRRMLMLKTECGVSGIAITPVTGQPGHDATRFMAECENVTHYPDGVEILCPDTEDEHDCRIVTVKRAFPHLHLPKP